MEAQAITEVEIKEQQLVIAQWMQVPEEIIGILNQELPWRIREWIYLCALDQMPAEILEKMPTWELEKIQRERMEFLQKKFQDIDLLERAMKENQDRLEILAANSERLTTVVQDGLEKVLQDLTKEKEELKQKSEQLLKEKRELEFQLQQMKQHLVKEQESRQSAEENARILSEKADTYHRELLQFQKAEKRQVPKETIPTVEPEKGYWKNRRHQKMAKEQEEQRKKEMETFIKEVMDNSEFTEEQSDYLLTCLERGDKVEDVLYLAKPSLSVEHMERMRKMEQKRRMEASGQKTQRKRHFWEREKH